MSQGFQVEIVQAPRGRDTLNFFVGLAVIGVGLWLTWNHFVPKVLVEQTDGFKSGITDVMTLVIDTVFMVGWISVTFTSLMWKFSKRVYSFGSIVVDRLQGKSSVDDISSQIVATLKELHERLKLIEKVVDLPDAKEAEVLELKRRLAELEVST